MKMMDSMAHDTFGSSTAKKATPPNWAVPALIAGILLIAAAMRIYHIGHASIWWDEGFSHRWATMPVNAVVHETMTEDYNPPLYYLILNGWVRLFGDSAVSMRVPSVIGSIIAVWLTYVVGRLLVSRNAALLATAAMAVSSYQIVYAQQARAYGLLMMFTLGSIYFFLRLLQEWKLTLAIGYVLTTAIMLYTHVYGVFFLAMECFVVLAIWIARWKTALTIGRAIVTQAALLVVLIPWLMFAISRGKAADSSFWIEKPTIRVIAGAFKRIAGSNAAVAVFLILIAVAVYVMATLWRRTRAAGGDQSGAVPGVTGKDTFASSRAGGGPTFDDSLDSADGPRRVFTLAGTVAFLLAWLIIPHLLPIVASYAMHPIYFHRYTIATFPAMCLLAAIGVFAIRPRVLATIAGVALIGVLSFDALAEMHRSANTVSTRLAAFVDSKAGKNDVFVFDGHSGGLQNTFDYYNQRHDLPEKFIHWSWDQIDHRYTDELKSYGQGHDSIWLVTLYTPGKDKILEDSMKSEYPYITKYPDPTSAGTVLMYSLRFSRTPLP